MTYSTVSLEEMLAGESEEFRQSVQQRTAELIAEELTLRDLRRGRKVTQARLSKKLKIGQEGVSRMEKRSDLYISTLRSYVEGLGGKLKLVVELPDRPPINLTGLGEDRAQKRANMKPKNTLKSKSKAGRAA